MGLFDFFKKKKAEEQAATPEVVAAEREELTAGLEKTKQGLFSKLARAVAGRSKVDDDMLDELEEILITSDVGVETTVKIIRRIEERVARDKYMNAALKRGATVAVIAHNHPYGPICPSEGDRATTSLIQGALSRIGVMLAEHYVVSGERYLGFMNHMESAFAQKPRIAKFIRSKKESQHAIE